MDDSRLCQLTIKLTRTWGSLSTNSLTQQTLEGSSLNAVCTLTDSHTYSELSSFFGVHFSTSSSCSAVPEDPLVPRMPHPCWVTSILSLSLLSMSLCSRPLWLAPDAPAGISVEMISRDAVVLVTKLMVHFLHRVHLEEGSIPHQSQEAPSFSPALISRQDTGRWPRGTSTAQRSPWATSCTLQQPPGP